MDELIKNVSGNSYTKVANGTDGQFLRTVGTAPEWVDEEPTKDGGLLTGGVVTITGATTFQVTAGTAIIDKWVTPGNSVRIEVSWSQFSAQTVPNLATTTFTSLAIDEFGALQQFDGTPLTPQQNRIMVPLQTIIHASLTQLDGVGSGNRPAYQQTEAILDYIASIGPSNNGNAITASAGANLAIQKAAGTTTLPFINRIVDPQNPATRTNTALTPVTSMITTYQDSTAPGGFAINVAQTVLDPEFWDDGSDTLQAVANNKWTVQRVYLFGTTDDLVVTYGQAEYSNQADAEAAIFSESPTVNPFLSGATFLTAVIMKKGVTDLTNPAEAEFVSIDLPGSSSSGGGIGDMTKAIYDPTNVNTDAFALENFSSNVNAQTGTTYTLLGSDHGKTVSLDNASAIVLTVPAGLRADFYCYIVQKGVGVVTITESGTTVNNFDNHTDTAGQWAGVSLVGGFGTNVYLSQGRTA